MATIQKYWVSLAIAAAVLMLAVFMLWPRQPDTPAETWPPLLTDPAFQADLAAVRPHVTVVAPASGLHGGDPARLRALTDFLGLRLPAEALASGVVPYTANSDAVRLRLLTEALADPATGILWAMRGGYGVGRLLPALAETVLAESGLPARPKIVVGYSDITFLHLFVNGRGWPSVHAAMVWELASGSANPDNARRLLDLLARRPAELRYAGLRPLNAPARAAATLSGPVIGGNLTCVAASVGTPWQPDTAGRILFLEDVKEKGYRLDRLLTQLGQAGLVAPAVAVLLGDFTQGDDNTDFALSRFAAECPVPVFRTDLFGHGEKNYPLILGAPAVIAPDGETFSLTITNTLPPL